MHKEKNNMAKKIVNKKFWESKTFWMNILAVTTGVMVAINNDLITGTTLTGMGLINIVLRAMTDQNITF
jgi:hypothetical protein